MNADKTFLTYQSGEEIRAGDRVLFHREGAEVEFVALDPSDPHTGWFAQEYGGGVMISDPKVSEHTFIPSGHLDHNENLEFVSRADAPR